MSIAELVVKGIRWNTVGVAVSNAIQLVQVVVLGRFLLPAEFGIISALTIVSLYAGTVSSGGFSNAVIQESDLDSAQVSTLFWINLTIGFGLALLLVLASGGLATFFGIASAKYFYALALVFLFSGVAQLFSAVLQRQMMFRLLVVIEIITALFSFGLLVALLMFGYGVWAYVAGLTLRAVLNCCLKYLAMSREWSIGLQFDYGGSKKLVRFGLYQLGERLLDRFSLTVDRLVVASLLGPAALGQYHLALSLVRRPVRLVYASLGRVAYPAFAKANHEGRRLERLYSSLTKGVLLGLCPVLLFIAFGGKQLFSVLLGENWETAGNAAVILAIIALVKGVGNLGGSVILSKGRADVAFIWKVIWVILLTGVSWVGLAVNGLFGLLYGLLLLNVVAVVPWHWLVRWIGDISYVVFLKTLLPIGIATVLCSALLRLIPSFMPSGTSDTVVLAIFALTVAATFSATLWLMDRKDVQSFLQLVTR